jgi:hypothetical protein
MCVPDVFEQLDSTDRRTIGSRETLEDPELLAGQGQWEARAAGAMACAVDRQIAALTIAGEPGPRRPKARMRAISSWKANGLPR